MGTLTNALKALFTKSNITSDSSRAVPILNSAKEVEGSMALSNLLELAAQKICGTTTKLTGDLNNYKTAGVFRTGQASETNALTNCPVTGGAIVLIVFNPYGIMNLTSGSFQLILTFATIGTGIFYRTQSGGEWLGWKVVNMTAV